MHNIILNDIIQLIKDKISDPEQIFYFILGFISAWFPRVEEKIYLKASDVLPKNNTLYRSNKGIND